MFLAGYPWMDDLSVACDYGNILDGDKPTCYDSARAAPPRASLSSLFVICLDLRGGAESRTRRVALPSDRDQ